MTKDLESMEECTSTQPFGCCHGEIYSLTNAIKLLQSSQRSIPIMDIATYRLNQPRAQCCENHLICKTRWEGRDAITITISVQCNSIHLLRTGPGLCRMKPPIRFEEEKN